jgi:hypothetical protein
MSRTTRFNNARDNAKSIIGLNPRGKAFWKANEYESCYVEPATLQRRALYLDLKAQLQDLD